MSTKYKNIHAGSTKIWADLNGCGDDYCNCHWVNIYTNKGHLWESSWLSGWSFEKGYSEELEECKAETQEACDHYGIKCNLEDECFWDWEFEDRIL